ncbi:MAG: tRNA (uridine(34)/cytosine(34)/5-carboxymethylaminomethyluridine(34)-2'-O)-methyltransferase TrmL [Proteobacteria bacterium]|nr:tRNA (uridine(34)/cytosine(34)/5-carboxymethylaminomethyluridine(34)-2'-O)-methyltransferase TrmL [Pseudomonadota bacterium]NOG60218.1 tRNA (uridine(34)/cytosine(34)/5-carboxymethylaminomethyluridine(34)-2'-O)-methyltransferase TrmL [Pseudomonadota bacterium]
MFNIVLYEPEIPPNTGNIIRLCANTGANLHLIHPLGFDMNEKSLRRAGLDYIDQSIVHHYDNYQDYINKQKNGSLYAISTKGTQTYSESTFNNGDSFIFGPETRGLPKNILDEFNADKILRIPMIENSRSLNLSNSASIIIYEAWRQHNFK